MFGLNKNVYCIIKRLHNRKFWWVISSLYENKIIDYVMIDQDLLILTLMKLYFINLLLALISVVEVVTLLMIHMLEFVFQIK